jgi:hypothetical protein
MAEKFLLRPPRLNYFGGPPSVSLSDARTRKKNLTGNPFFVRQFLSDLERDGLVDTTPNCVGR